MVKSKVSIVSNRKNCAICQSPSMEEAINLPELPLTGLYCTSKEELENLVIDQQLLVCVDCGHVQLKNIFNTGLIYDETYSFRTSESAKAKMGTQFFISVLDSLTKGKKFKCVLDIGCNDLYLLRQLADKADKRIGIDPIWKGREDCREDKDIVVFGGKLEDVSSIVLKDLKPDLIVCRHTLEHIEDPRLIMDTLREISDDNALFLFEVPGFEAIIDKLRYDQIFHQHQQYFTVHSFKRLLIETGYSYLDHRLNYHDWGATTFSFQKNRDTNKTYDSVTNVVFKSSEISKSYNIFKEYMIHINTLLSSLADEEVYGYGAAQMLPILAYHIGSDLSNIKVIIDDDPAKRGLYYKNLPLKIEHSLSFESLEEKSFLITAPDNIVPILTKLFHKRPKRIIIPLQYI